ncbi:MAG: right-handed parallel beta-helix repeat-containing protein, partial [Planctomycetota bacterium]
AYGHRTGSAYVFDLTTGFQLAKLTTSEAWSYHEFGWSVAIDGNTAIIGAPYDDSTGSYSTGSAYLFDVTTGTQLAKLTASDASSYDDFGFCVAIDGNTAIIGAPSDDDAGSSSGSAYLFDVTTGTQVAKLTASDAAPYDEFGRCVAIDGNTVIIGAPRDDDAGGWSGSAYLFDVTTRTQVAKLTASDAAPYDEFGASVAIDGSTAIVGAPYVAWGRGAAYLFDVPTGTELAKVIASDGLPYDHFGYSVAIDGHTAVIGVPYDDDIGIEDRGSAYCVFGVPAQPEPAIVNCIITENLAGEGGGLYCNSSNPVIANCQIVGNYSLNGGGIMCWDFSSVNILSSTIAGNFAEYYGAGVGCFDGSAASIASCILWDNSAALLGDAICVGAYGSAEPSGVTIDYSDIQNGQGGIHVGPDSTVNWASGNIDVDPLFVSPGYWDLGDWVDGDYRLLFDSFCIDAGDPNYPADAYDFDLGGNRRICEGRVDMGAYEYCPERVVDLNNDGIVDFADFAFWADRWQHTCSLPDWCGGRDFDWSGAVDSNDLRMLCERWLQEYPIRFYEFSLDADPNWATTGQWAFGQPSGDGGSEYGNPDPTSGRTGSNVYGVNLRGDYSTAVGGPYYVTAGPFDCGDYNNVNLRFARWLNTDEPGYVETVIEVSDNGTSWTTIWENTRSELTDGSWRIVDYDISSITDGWETVYIRWGYEVHEYAYPYSGWNIDDIQLSGNPKQIEEWGVDDGRTQAGHVQSGDSDLM